jgi:hypothetical protein
MKQTTYLSAMSYPCRTGMAHLGAATKPSLAVLTQRICRDDGLLE